MTPTLTTGDQQIDALLPKVRDFLAQDTVDYCIDAEIVHGYRSPDCPALWIRDHSDMLRGARYFDTDMTSAVTHFAQTQLGNGSFHDFVSCNMDRENWTKYVRVPVEADVEYRWVKALFLAWQATGDDKWMESMLPHAERAMAYVCTHPWRWSEEHALVKRALTMDTWDFDYVCADQSWLNFQITGQTHWGIFHGDNSGYYEAFLCLAQLYEHLGDAAAASRWSTQAGRLRQRANDLCWNGSFYTHRVPLDDFRVQGVDEAAQLSLSNPMAINRGLATAEQSQALLDEYIRRGNSQTAFAPWYSIDPPFPDGCFGDPLLVGGAYINGGIFPLVGGELARAAFAHGREKFGVDILRQYSDLIVDSGETYLWYFPDGRPSSEEASTSPDAMSTDGWGSSAMLYALVEGLAGITDTDTCFRQIALSPRWAAADIKTADIQLEYAASGSAIGYHYEQGDGGCQLTIKSSKCLVDLHLLLPEGQETLTTTVSGRAVSNRRVTVAGSTYVDMELVVDGEVTVDVEFR